MLAPWQALLSQPAVMECGPVLAITLLHSTAHEQYTAPGGAHPSGA
jgi:hypothetical protein